MRRFIGQECVGKDGEHMFQSMAKMAASTSESTSEPQPSVDMVSQFRESFIDMMDQFLTAGVEVWPDCPAVRTYKAMFDTKLSMARGTAKRNENAVKAITMWHESVSPYYQMCADRDDNVMDADVAMVKQLKMKEKWTSDLHPETKEAVWEYINQLNQFANMYCIYQSVPGGMLGTIQNIAADIAGKISNGEMSMNDLNLQRLGQQVAGALSASDIEEFGRNMTQGGAEQQMQQLGFMYNSLQSIMSNANANADAQ